MWDLFVCANDALSYPYIDLARAVLQPRYVRRISHSSARVKSGRPLCVGCPEHTCPHGRGVFVSRYTCCPSRSSSRLTGDCIRGFLHGTANAGRGPCIQVWLRIDGPMVVQIAEDRTAARAGQSCKIGRWARNPVVLRDVLRSVSSAIVLRYVRHCRCHSNVGRWQRAYPIPPGRRRAVKGARPRYAHGHGQRHHFDMAEKVFGRALVKRSGATLGAQFHDER
jgi:hypothetical protein